MREGFTFILVRAEIMKHYRNYHKSLSSTMSLIIWPLLSFILLYYTYSSFDLSLLSFFKISSKKEFIIFLSSGTLVYNSFLSTVQSAFEISQERENGTIEIIFLSPVNRLTLMYARALGCFYGSMGLFLIFFIIILVNVQITLLVLVQLFISLIIIVFSATIWGGLINSLFLVSRDSAILLTIFDEPMRFFSGSTIPTGSFPIIFKFISTLFPATYCITLVRSIVMGRNVSYFNYLGLFISLFILILVTMYILKMAEEKNKKTGNLQLY